jgi:hypothetical protein
MVLSVLCGCGWSIAPLLEHAFEYHGLIRGGEFIDQLSDWRFVIDSATLLLFEVHNSLCLPCGFSAVWHTEWKRVRCFITEAGFLLTRMNYTSSPSYCTWVHLLYNVKFSGQNWVGQSTARSQDQSAGLCPSLFVILSEVFLVVRLS